MKQTLGRIGLVAIRREMKPLRDWFQEEGQVRWGEGVLCAGTIGGHPVALAEVLPGPVNGALGAQGLVAQYDVEALISFGSAGALAPGLSPGDLVIVRRAVAHDAGVFLGQQYQHTGVMGRDRRGRTGYRRAFIADPGLIALARASVEATGARVHTGTVATGNQIVTSEARARWLHRTFGALAVDMETAAVAQVAVAYRVPWVAVRSVSDNADEHLVLDRDRLHLYLDDTHPDWLRWAGRWFYLLTHPQTLRRLRRLQHGLNLAARRSAQVVGVMLQRAECRPDSRSQAGPAV